MRRTSHRRYELVALGVRRRPAGGSHFHPQFPVYFLNTQRGGARAREARARQCRLYRRTSHRRRPSRIGAGIGSRPASTVRVRSFLTSLRARLRAAAAARCCCCCCDSLRCQPGSQRSSVIALSGTAAHIHLLLHAGPMLRTLLNRRGPSAGAVKDREFTDAEVGRLARYQMATIEKWSIL